MFIKNTKFYDIIKLSDIIFSYIKKFKLITNVLLNSIKITYRLEK